MQVNGWNLIFSVPVYNSLEDHHHEIMSFCWENGYHGVLSDEGEFALYNPPKYFSAHDLKLSYQVIPQFYVCIFRWFRIFQTSSYQGIVKTTVSGVFEDLKFETSEGSYQNWSCPESVSV